MKRLLFSGAVFLFFALFLIVPLVAVFVRAIGAGESGTALSTFVRAIGSARMGRIVGFTSGQAAVSALAGVLLALPLAFIVSHYEFALKRFVYSLSLVPFVLPSIIVVVCMISFYGRSGLISSIFGSNLDLVYSFRGIVLAHVFYDFSLAIRVIASAWHSIDRRYRESAESLGESRSGLFFRVTLPLLTPAIVSGFVLIFIYTFLSFGIVLVFGGVRYATLEVAIYQSMFVDLDLVSAAAYAVVQLLLSGALIFASTRLINDSGSVRVATARDLPRLASAPPAARAAMSAYLVLIFVFVLGPLATMVGRAFSGDHRLTFQAFRELLIPGAGARDVASIIRSTIGGVIARSVAIAVASGTLTFAVSTSVALAGRSRPSVTMQTLLMLPIAISLVTVSVGLRFVWGGLIPPAVLVVIGQFFVAFPLVFRIVQTGVSELGDAPGNAARTLGASRWRVFADIEFPLMRRTLLNAYAYSLALPFADLTIVLAAGRGRVTTFPVAIYRLIGFRSFDLALALAVIYIVLCLVLFLIIDRTSLATKGAS